MQSSYFIVIYFVTVFPLLVIMSQRTTGYIRPACLTVKSLGTYQNQSEILNISALTGPNFPLFFTLQAAN